MMKSKSVILFCIFAVIGILAFFIVKITNEMLEKTYKDGCRTTFLFLSEIADDYMKRESELNRIEIESLKGKGYNILQDYLRTVGAPLNEGLDGVWIFKDSLVMGMTAFAGMENKILELYNSELKDKDYETIISIGDNPFNLVNVSKDDYNVLLLLKSNYGKSEDISAIIDSLVSFSNLVYFSILDKNGFSVVYSSRDQDSLIIKGEVENIVATPQGNVFQLEGKIGGGSIVAGFSLNLLDKIITTNRIILVLVFCVFAVVMSILLYRITKLGKSGIDIEREARHLEEIGALSSGFSQEIRKSLSTLSQLSRNMEGEQGEILKEEVKKMNLVMDSIKLLILSEVDKTTIDIDNTIAEAISLTDNRNNSVEIKSESTIKLKILGNSSLLVSAFSNIFKNAVEADADKVRIHMRKTGNIVRILIIDNGRGLEKDKIGRVFEPFYSGKRQSGLGLYLARKIIEYHGGSIKLESGKETRVDILLPIKD